MHVGVEATVRVEFGEFGIPRVDGQPDFIVPELVEEDLLGMVEQIKQSVRLAVLKPLVAIAVFVLDVLPIALLATVTGAIMWVPLLWAILGVGVSAWLQMRMIRKAFALE